MHMLKNPRKPAAHAKAEAKPMEVIERDMQTRLGRAQVLQARRGQILSIIRARAAFPDHQDVPGGDTGLVVTTRKAVGKQVFKEHQVDVPLLRELRETERQIAQELGQWVDKSDVNAVIVVEGDVEQVAEILGRMGCGQKLTLTPDLIDQLAPLAPALRELEGKEAELQEKRSELIAAIRAIDPKLLVSPD